MPDVLFGNTNDMNAPPGGWFVGHFITPPEDPRSTGAVEVKWHTHPAGDTKSIWTKANEATTLAILISGKFQFRFPKQEVLLLRQGDFVLWPPDVFHCWHAEEESVVLTIRWPSRQDDVVIAGEEQVHDFEL